MNAAEAAEVMLGAVPVVWVTLPNVLGVVLSVGNGTNTVGFSAAVGLA